MVREISPSPRGGRVVPTDAPRHPSGPTRRADSAAARLNGLRTVARAASPLLPADCTIVSATKGLEEGTMLRMSEVLDEECPGARAVVRRAIGERRDRPRWIPSLGSRRVRRGLEVDRLSAEPAAFVARLRALSLVVQKPGAPSV
jgi:hypothetical protein